MWTDPVRECPQGARPTLRNLQHAGPTKLRAGHRTAPRTGNPQGIPSRRSCPNRQACAPRHLGNGRQDPCDPAALNQRLLRRDRRPCIQAASQARHPTGICPTAFASLRHGKDVSRRFRRGLQARGLPAPAVSGRGMPRAIGTIGRRDRGCQDEVLTEPFQASFPGNGRSFDPGAGDVGTPVFGRGHRHLTALRERGSGHGRNSEGRARILTGAGLPDIGTLRTVTIDPELPFGDWRQRGEIPFPAVSTGLHGRDRGQPAA